MGIEFVHGDIRDYSDFLVLDKEYDLFIEASAEPSVHAGLNGGLDYLIDTNLNGAVNCLKFAIEKCKKFLFLSTSRVYSLEALKNIPLKSEGSRLIIDAGKKVPNGISGGGIQEDFCVSKARSYYGTIKLSAEYFVQEFANTFNLKAIINRCGVIAGPGQLGKVDQGVFTLWVANHYFKKGLSYTGFGGNGHQVRDLLHIDDLYELIVKQVQSSKGWSGEVFNAGGGLAGSVSLREFTSFCEEVTGNLLDIVSKPETSPFDIPYYVTCNDLVNKNFDWSPAKSPKVLVDDIYLWLRENESMARAIFG